MKHSPINIAPARKSRRRTDGWDDNDPSAPDGLWCVSCGDHFRETLQAYCPDCEEVTRSYLSTGFRREASTGLISMGEDPLVGGVA